MSLQMHEHSTVPPGFRFHPTDEELVGYYLQKKVACKKIDLDVIREIDLYRMEPWDLQERCRIGTGEQHEWYFFSHKDKKYPTGTRTNRATGAGFWKATGRDKAIFSKYKVIGMRKTLVFYRGRAPNGQKTDWIMHEYRLQDESSVNCINEEGWVVCRVFKKRLIHRRMGENDAACCYEEQVALLPELESPENMLKENLCYSRSFVCKEELDLEDYEPYTYSFSQIPQLGSPSGYCDGSHSSVVGLILESSSRAAINHPLPLLCEVPEFDGHRLKSNARTDHCSGSQEDAMMEWSVVDRLVAEQLGQDETSKDLSLRFLTSCTESVGEVASLMQASKASQQLDYSYAGDADLWSFVR